MSAGVSVSLRGGAAQLRNESWRLRRRSCRGTEIGPPAAHQGLPAHRRPTYLIGLDGEPEDSPEIRIPRNDHLIASLRGGGDPQVHVGHGSAPARAVGSPRRPFVRIALVHPQHFEPADQPLYSSEILPPSPIVASRTSRRAGTAMVRCSAEASNPSALRAAPGSFWRISKQKVESTHLIPLTPHAANRLGPATAGFFP